MIFFNLRNKKKILKRNYNKKKTYYNNNKNYIKFNKKLNKIYN
jgi:hypothetical protein